MASKSKRAVHITFQLEDFEGGFVHKTQTVNVNGQVHIVTLSPLVRKHMHPWAKRFIFSTSAGMMIVAVLALVRIIVPVEVYLLIVTSFLISAVVALFTGQETLVKATIPLE